MIPLFWSESVEAEVWNGPVYSEAEAVAAAKQTESECGGAIDLIWIAAGTELDPATLIDSEWLFDFLSDSDETCPLETPWKEYWGLDTAGFEELNSFLVEAFRSFAEARKLRKYYNITGEPKKVKLL